jgi:hypothetical protein
LRRRTKPSLAVRLRAFWLFAALAAFAVFALGVTFANLPQLRVRSVDASVPPGPLARDAVLAAAHVDPGANLWLLDTGALRRRVEALPYVATATVRRAQFPLPAVAIEVTLREPAECVRTGAGTVTVDGVARVLQAGCASALLPLVEAGGAAAAPGDTLSAPGTATLLADTRAIAAHVRVRLVRRDRFGGIEAIDARGVLLRFGDDADLPAKVALVEPIRAGAGRGRPLRAIDLRAPTTPIVEFP